MNDHSARALQQRLDDDGGDFMPVLGKQLLQFVQALDVAGRAREADRAVRAIRRVGAQHRNAPGIERRGEGRIVAHGHRAGRVAVIRVFQRDNAALLGTPAIVPILQRQFQRHFDGGRAVVRKKDVTQRRRHDFAQPRGKLFRRLVRKSREQHVLQPRGLLGDGLRDRRMRMAVQVYPPRRNRIQNLAAVLVSINTPRPPRIE